MRYLQALASPYFKEGVARVETLGAKVGINGNHVTIECRDVPVATILSVVKVMKKSGPSGTLCFEIATKDRP